MRKSFMAVLVGAAGLAAGFFVSNAAAHHGWGGYTIELDMDATVKQVILTNPHDRLIVVDDKDEEWNLLLAPPVRNRRFGYGEGSLSVGDRVKLIGERHRSRNEAKIHQIWRDDELVYEYMYSSGVTSLDRNRR